MAKQRPKVIQNIFEVRYSHGYRYLDRCGDAMIVLEEGLPTVSNGKLWLPEETAPTGARMKCPDLDLVLLFDSARLCLDQNPAGMSCPFADMSKYIYDTLTSKFDIRKIERVGARQIYLMGTESIADADKLSATMAPWNSWISPRQDGLSVTKCEAKTVLESKDRLNGVNFSIRPVFKQEAPLQIDQRLNRPPHLLDSNQREVLISQLKRQKQRDKDPVAGLGIDVDYWRINPPDVDIVQFMRDAQQCVNELLESLQEYKK